ncbi:MAG: complex I NDUFA9 subunit family protein [Kiloniellales bacterium]|nr:complex I NDUFA9 subunit family protein [Kiloniellales bacterium]MDJ0981350.1 complex I NDUFA9 subunit family protein [Kiloniellales bacterium]
MATRVVTVFGASGFLGRYVVGRLAREGWLIRAAVRHPRRAAFLKPLGDVGQITPLRAPIQDGDLVRTAVEGADAVVNLVGILFERGRQSFKDVHAEGAAHVARAAEAAGVRDLVQVSAIGADIRAEADYARSKGAAEMAVRSSFPEAVILRPSIVFGPEDGFFNRFGAMARLSPALPLIGGGETRFQPVFVGNVADAVMKALSDPACRGRVYELGGPQVYSFKELMDLLLRQIRRRRLLVPLPFALASLQGAFLEWLPTPPLTRDQVRLLKSDNVVAEDALTLADLGIEATHPEVILPTYMQRYCPGGRVSPLAA